MFIQRLMGLQDTAASLFFKSIFFGRAGGTIMKLSLRRTLLRPGILWAFTAAKEVMVLFVGSIM